MRRLFIPACVIIIVIASLTPASVLAARWPGLQQPYLAAAAAPQPGVVRAVLFWLTTCGHCHKVINETLPPLQQKYGDKLQISKIEISSPAATDVFERAATTMGVSLNDAGVPFLIIGDRALIGSLQIPLELPGLIEKYLAAGGVDYPNVPGLADLLAASGASATVAAPSQGFELAWLVMALLAAALIYAVFTFVWQQQGRATPRPAAWARWAIPVLSIVGLGVALYLAYVEVTAREAVCGPVGDCNAVQSSPYARLFGVLPIGLFGAIGYLVLLAAWLWGRFRQDKLADYAPLAIFGMALFGVLFSIYLTYLELYVIQAVCAWCLTSAAIMALLLFVSTGPAVRSVQPAVQAASQPARANTPKRAQSTFNVKQRARKARRQR